MPDSDRCICRHRASDHSRREPGPCGALVDPVEGDTCECDAFQPAAPLHPSATERNQ